MKVYARDYNFLLPRYWFGQVDSRPLSVFRILFSLILLKDALYHLPLAHSFYSDAGIVPRATLWDGLARSSRFSLMDAIASAWLAQVFFLIWIAVIICLLLGYRTRLMTLLNFILLLSVHERNIYVLNGADTVMRVLSFWILFVPLGQYYSVDVLRRRWLTYQKTRRLADLRVDADPHTTFALPLRLIQLQIGLIYLFTFLLKLPGNTWEHGDALHYALQLRSLTLPTGDLVYQVFPADLLRVMTVSALVIEGIFFIFVFIPLFQPVMRLFALVGGFLLHTGIALMMSIGNFSPVMIVSYLTLFEASWIIWLDRRLRVSPQKLLIPLPIVGSPIWLLLLLTRADELDVAEDVQARGVWVLDEVGTIQIGWSGWRLLFGNLPLSRGWLPLLDRVVGLRWLLERGARWLTRRLSLPEPQSLKQVSTASAPPRLFVYSWRLAQTAILVPLMIIVIASNLTGIQNHGKPVIKSVPDRPFNMMRSVGLWQHWGMFSPYPTKVDGWIEIPGTFEDGTTFDLRTGEAVSDDMPRWFIGWNMRWKKYEANINEQRLEPLLSAWGAYYCRQYNNLQQLPVGQRLATLEIHWRYVYSADPGEPANDLEVVRLWRQWCYEEYQ